MLVRLFGVLFGVLLSLAIAVMFLYLLATVALMCIVACMVQWDHVSPSERTKMIASLPWMSLRVWLALLFGYPLPLP